MILLSMKIVLEGTIFLFFVVGESGEMGCLSPEDVMVMLW